MDDYDLDSDSDSDSNSDSDSDPKDSAGGRDDGTFVLIVLPPRGMIGPSSAVELRELQLLRGPDVDLAAALRHGKGH